MELVNACTVARDTVIQCWNISDMYGRTSKGSELCCLGHDKTRKHDHTKPLLHYHQSATLANMLLHYKTYLHTI